MEQEDQQNSVVEGDVADAAAPAGNVSLQTAALKFLRWAHSNALLRVDSYYPGDGYDAPDFDEVEDRALALLRQKQIRFVGVNQVRQEITVFLNKAAPGDRLLKHLPKTCDGFQLKYRQGSPNPVSPVNVAEAANPCAIHVSEGGAQTYTCGSSISVGNSRGAGTLGCLVRDAAGVLYGLSNNHVSGSCNYAPVGLPIVAPGVLDVSPINPPPFTLGFHVRQLPMQMGDPTIVDSTQNQDAAIFNIFNPGIISSMQQSHYDTPASAIDLRPGMEVEKVGRSSGHTKGRVVCQAIGPIDVAYTAPQHNFNGMVYFEPMYFVHGLSDRFSEAGDSGSLVVHQDAAGVRHAVGIVVAGGEDSSAPGGKLSLIMPIRPILDQLGVSLVSGHNV